MPIDNGKHPTWLEQLDFSARRHTGFGRDTQEDHAYTILEVRELGMSLPTQHLEEAGLLFIVADGMGGEGHGEVASRTACYAVLRAYKDYLESPSDPETFFRKALNAAYLSIRAKIEESRNLEGMGTTLTMALVQREHVYTYHIGDSRIYRHHKDARLENALEQQTTDHAAKEDRHVLLQAVGLKHMLPPDAPSESARVRRLQPDMSDFPICLGKDDLILCSDGLWSVVSKEEMAMILRQSSSALEANVKLIGLANQRGGPDNISVIAIKTKAPLPSAASKNSSTLPAQMQRFQQSDITADLPSNRCVLLGLWVLFIPFENKVITIYEQWGSDRIIPLANPDENLFLQGNCVVGVQQMSSIEGLKRHDRTKRKRLKEIEIPETVREIIRNNLSYKVRNDVDELLVDQLFSNAAGAGNDVANKTIVKQFQMEDNTVLSTASEIQKRLKEKTETPYDLNLCAVEFLVLYPSPKRREKWQNIWSRFNRKAH